MPAPTASADADLERGLALVRAGDEAGAIDDFTRAIERDPESAEAHRWRGHCFNFIGDYDAALADYDRAIELDPDYAWSHYARGMANHNLGRFDAALAGYTRAIELDAGFVKAWNWRGFTRQLTGDYRGAASDLEHSLDIADDDVWTLTVLAKTRLALGEFDACEDALRRASTLDATNASVRAQLGFLAAVRGSTADSIAQLESACAAHAPEEVHARIWIWMQRADRDAADRELRAWFDEARIDDPWELRLAAFLLGEGTDAGLIEAAAAETASRIARGAPPDFLACEALFYAALRHERRGEIEAAIEFHVRAHVESAQTAWEWHMADARFRALGRRG
jgi:Tfp pilus assembly protein PilF